MHPIPVEFIGDTTRAAIGLAVSLDARIQWDAANLAIIEETLLYTFRIWSTQVDGLKELRDTAKRTLGLEPVAFAPVPGIPYETGGLWDLLPRIEHVPQGLSWAGDFSPCSRARSPYVIRMARRQPGLAPGVRLD